MRSREIHTCTCDLRYHLSLGPLPRHLSLGSLGSLSVLYKKDKVDIDFAGYLVFFIHYGKEGREGRRRRARADRIRHVIYVTFDTSRSRVVLSLSLWRNVHVQLVGHGEDVHVGTRRLSRAQVTGIWTVADGRPTEYWINKIMNKVSFVNDLCTHSREKWLIIQNFPFKPCIQTPMTPIYLPVIVPISCAHGLANGDTHTHSFMRRSLQYGTSLEWQPWSYSASIIYFPFA